MLKRNSSKNISDLVPLGFVRVLRFFVLILPVCLFFSYYPIISFGSNESMNFELSIPLVWLVLFDVVGLVSLIKNKSFLGLVKGKWFWWLFPVWLSVSLIWSLNRTRGFLTVGILWSIIFAGYIIWNFREVFDTRFRKKWLKWFLGSSLVICAWCFLQCVLDLLGVSREVSLMCEGCTYQMFGFPHPNGFAIEPQFMGNLLLAPLVLCIWLLSIGHNHEESETTRSSRFLWLCLVIISIALFLTFSRGAIYSAVVGAAVMSVMMLMQEQKKRSEACKRVCMVWSVLILCFVVGLNVQGVMAEVGPTSDTYFDGVAKVLNHLSLGVIDIKGGENKDESVKRNQDEIKKDNDQERNEVVEKPVENFRGTEVKSEDDRGEKEKSVFQGYVAESTDVRVKLSGAAVEVWSQNSTNALFGVGLGGAGIALYDSGLSPSPKEIVQNEYASLLIETGLVGVSLLVLMAILLLRGIWNNPARIVLISIAVSYGVSLFFFSGLPNALHVYLLPVVIFAIYDNGKRKKLVS